MPEGRHIPHSAEPPTGATRPWVLHFARAPGTWPRRVNQPPPTDASKAVVPPFAAYDEELRMSVGLYDGPLPWMPTHTPDRPRRQCVESAAARRGPKGPMP